MDDNLSAKERKRLAQKEPVALRRSGKIRIFHDSSISKPKPSPIKYVVVGDTREDPLTKQSRFVDMRPKEVHPWDWHTLYTEDESLWEALAEEAVAAVEAGELRRHDRLR